MSAFLVVIVLVAAAVVNVPLYSFRPQVLLLSLRQVAKLCFWSRLWVGDSPNNVQHGGVSLGWYAPCIIVCLLHCLFLIHDETI